MGYLCIGVSLGAMLVPFMKFDGRKLAKCLIVCTFIIFTLSLCQRWIGCNGVVSQIQEMSLQNPTSRPMWPSCTGCVCESSDFYPVCANDTRGTPYYSPCHAGCANFTYEITKINVKFQFDYCACAETPRTLVSRDFCRDNCDETTGAFVVLFSITSLLSGVLVVPTIMMAMRSTTNEYRSISLGILAFCVYLFGVLPSTMFYRYVTDSSCFVWKSVCGKGRGYCEMYDTETLRSRFHGFAALLNLLAYIFYGLVWYHAKNMTLTKHIITPPTDVTTTILTDDLKKEEKVETKNGLDQNGDTVKNGHAEGGEGQITDTFVGKM